MISEARKQLEEIILPFWLERGPDPRHGGFFTCFDNRGRNLVSTQKFTWSQGRFVWLLARAARLAASGAIAPGTDLIPLAERGARFLTEHAIRPDGTCHFVLEADGTPTAGPNGETHSVYADCFVAMGLCELATATSSAHWLEAAEPLLRRASADIASGRADTAPYPVPVGWSAFGPRMILLNTRLEHARALRQLGRLTPAALADLAAARDAMLAHRAADGTFVEMLGETPDDSLIFHHRVPGHALEGVWVALETGDLLGKSPDGLLESVSALCESGWDTEFGGIFRYVDSTGPREPGGSSGETAYERLVRDTWSTKLWWVHTEAAYTAALAARRYGDARAGEWAQRIWDYTIATFPGGHEGAEWIQIRDRAGRPLDQVVALPVKDPFHIARNLMQLIELEAATDA
ncbi:MAG TPA: AGE family epimerase/isomerase [Candidatus Limnocylindrales bacterium]